MIERRGTGGGNFRALYSRFLAEVGHEDEAGLAAAAAKAWTALAGDLFTASETDEPDPGGWNRIAASAASVLVAEERLWSALSP